MSKICQEIGGRGNKPRLLSLPDIKTYQKAVEIIIKGHFCRNGQIDQWVTIESRNRHMFKNLVDERDISNQWRKNRLFK